MRRRQFVIYLVWLTAIVAGLFGVVLVLSGGGFDITILGLRVRAHSPGRALMVSVAALVVLTALGELRPLTVGRRAVGRAAPAIVAAWPGARATAWTLAAGVVVVAWVFGTKAVGGADSYGYLSQAGLWRDGELKTPQPFVNDVPWPDASRTFAPLGYLAADQVEPAIVPGYSPGLPMLLALVWAVAGYQATFFVVPLLSGVLVLVTYALGRHLASPTAGLIGAWLVATSPAVLFMMMTTMTDVPVAAVWALAFYLVLTPGKWRALAAGVVAAVAVLIRPNLAPLAAVVGLRYVLRLSSVSTRRAAFVDAVLFGLGALPGAIAVAAINQYLYGSPTTSGYGQLSDLFAWSHVWPNVQRYVTWFAESQTPFAFIGAVALVLPTRRLWPGHEARSTTCLAAAAVLIVWVIYCFWEVFEAWWYLRFLLTSWPFIMVGVGAVLAALMRLRPALLTPVVVAAVVALGVYQVSLAAKESTFDLWEGERRYVVAAHMVRRMTDRNSVVIAGQHSGTVRFYGGRMTLRYDFLDRRWLDRAVEWMQSRGVHVYFLLEPWEIDEIKTRFEGQQTLALFTRTPRAIYQEPGRLYFFDATADAARNTPAEIVTGTERGLLAALPAPRPRLVFR